MNGHKEAVRLKKELGKLLAKNPIEGNGMDWFNLTRTLKTTLDIVEEKAKEDINKATRRAAGWSEEDLKRKVRDCFTSGTDEA